MALYLYMNFMYPIDTIILTSLFLNGAAFQFPSMICFIHLYYVKMSFKALRITLPQASRMRRVIKIYLL